MANVENFNKVGMCAVENLIRIINDNLTRTPGESVSWAARGFSAMNLIALLID
jgi:hypothetical protein